MTEVLQNKIDAAEKRIARLENVAWVLGAVALFLGIGGGSLWGKLSAANDRAKQIEESLTSYSARIEKEVDTRVKLGFAQLDERKSQIITEIEKLRGADPGWGVVYCVHQESHGWYDWVTDDAEAGKWGIGKRLESIKVVLYRKNTTPPSGKCA